MANSYRVYKKDGKEYSREYEAKSTYNPTSAKVAVGTKKQEMPETVIPEEVETPEIQEETNPENSVGTSDEKTPTSDENVEEVVTETLPEAEVQTENTDPLALE